MRYYIVFSLIIYFLVTPRPYATEDWQIQNACQTALQKINAVASKEKAVDELERVSNLQQTSNPTEGIALNSSIVELLMTGGNNTAGYPSKGVRNSGPSQHEFEIIQKVIAKAVYFNRYLSDDRRDLTKLNPSPYSLEAILFGFTTQQGLSPFHKKHRTGVAYLFMSAESLCENPVNTTQEAVEALLQDKDYPEFIQMSELKSLELEKITAPILKNHLDRYAAIPFSQVVNKTFAQLDPSMRALVVLRSSNLHAHLVRQTEGYIRTSRLSQAVSLLSQYKDANPNDPIIGPAYSRAEEDFEEYFKNAAIQHLEKEAAYTHRAFINALKNSKGSQEAARAFVQEIKRDLNDKVIEAAALIYKNSPLGLKNLLQALEAERIHQYHQYLIIN